jgi:hypothetical protein
MIEFKPVKEEELRELPEWWVWHSNEGEWIIMAPCGGSLYIGENGDMVVMDDYRRVPRQVIKALYVANGVEL